MESGQFSCWDSTVEELVVTERSYVRCLEDLCDLKSALERSGVIPEDVIQRVFLNINTVVDVQRRFLMRLEATKSMPQDRQEWGPPFVAFEDLFKANVPFIANYRQAARMAGEVFGQSAGHSIGCDFNKLKGDLMRPMSRLAKYPLILKDLRKHSELEAVKTGLSAGIIAIERVLDTVNEAVGRDLLDEALLDLNQRVTDWKTYQLDQLGKLLLHGNYAITSGSSDKEKDHEIYLFERILLCCREEKPNNDRDKPGEVKTTGTRPNENRRALRLRGRIFMADVIHVVAMPMSGSHIVQVRWKGDRAVESLMVKFRNEELMKKWSEGLLRQQEANNPQGSTKP